MPRLHATKEQTTPAFRKWLKNVVARNIRNARRQRGLNQRRLAKLSGLSQSRIAQAERAHQDRIPMTLVFGVARAMAVEPDTLLRTEAYPDPPKAKRP